MGGCRPTALHEFVLEAISEGKDYCSSYDFAVHDRQCTAISDVIYDEDRYVIKGDDFKILNDAGFTDRFIKGFAGSDGKNPIRAKIKRYVEVIEECDAKEEYGKMSVAIDGLGKFGSDAKSALPLLRKVIRDYGNSKFAAELAIEAFKSIAKIGGLSSYLTIYKAALNENYHSSVRSAAVKEMGNIKYPKEMAPFTLFRSHMVDLILKYPELRDEAAKALVNIGKTAVPDLARLLGHKDSGVRCSAAIGLAHFKGPEAFSELVNAILTDRDWAVRDAAMYALTEKNYQWYPELAVVAAPLFVTCLNYYQMLDSALSGLERISSSPKAKGAIPAYAIPELGMIISGRNCKWAYKSTAVDILGQIGSKDAVPYLIKDLVHQRHPVVERVLRALWEIGIGPEEASPELIDALGNVWIGTVYKTGYKKGDEYVGKTSSELLRNLVGDGKKTEPWLIDSFCRLMKIAGDKKVGGDLTDLAGEVVFDSDRVVAAIARVALNEWNGKDLRDKAARLLGKRGSSGMGAAFADAWADPAFKKAVSAALSDDKELSISDLITAMDDENPLIRIGAAHSIGSMEIKDKAMATKLLNMALEDSEPDVRQAASHALRAVLPPLSTPCR